MNPLKGIWAGLKGAAKGGVAAYRFATRPDVLGYIQLAGMFTPLPVNLLAISKVLRLVATAEQTFPTKGSGTQKLLFVLSNMSGMQGELEKLGVPMTEWLGLVEEAVKLMKGEATLTNHEGVEIEKEDLERLSALMEEVP